MEIAVPEGKIMFSKGMHIAFVTDCTSHQAWMAATLLHSANKVGQTDPITWMRWGCNTEKYKGKAVKSTDQQALMRKLYPNANVWDLEGFEDSQLRGDVSWIKPLSFKAFFDSNTYVDDDLVLAMLDADFIFMSKLRVDDLKERSIKTKNGLRTHHDSKPVVQGLVAVAQQYMCCDGLGAPYMMSAQAWRKMLPGWADQRLSAGKNWGAEQEAFSSSARKAGISFHIFDHFMVSDITTRNEHSEGWSWVKDAIKNNESDTCKTKVTHETTSKLPTFFHVVRPWQDSLSTKHPAWQFSKYQVPPGWQRSEAEGITDCEMPLFAEPPEDMMLAKTDEGDKLSSWGLCTIIHSLNDMLIDLKKAKCTKGYRGAPGHGKGWNDIKAFKVEKDWRNIVFDSAQSEAETKGMSFDFMKECGEHYKCSRPV